MDANPLPRMGMLATLMVAAATFCAGLCLVMMAAIGGVTGTLVTGPLSALAGVSGVTVGAPSGTDTVSTGVSGAGPTPTDPTAMPPLVGGQRATLLPDGLAAAPVDAPAAVRGIIAAGNEIVGKPYVYGGGHGLPLDEIASGYDCSSSVAHLLWGGGLLPVDTDMTAAEFEDWGLPGPGRWVTLYASGDHVFMYVAGLRWDTHNAAGPDDGTTGIGWHPLIREDAGFIARHPPGL